MCIRDRGSFSGKGIYDLAAVTAAWEGKIPENTILSHDLLEGNYARSGMATDVEVVEAYPTSYYVASRRDHRWIRGDWQLLPWILFRRQGIHGLGLWKMIDNLRRSLVPIAVVVGIITLVALLPPLAACVAIFALLAAYFIPPLFSLPAALSRRERGVIRSSYLGAVLEDARDGIILGPVSYTHLDVYKRQAPRRRPARGCPRASGAAVRAATARSASPGAGPPPVRRSPTAPTAPAGPRRTGGSDTPSAAPRRPPPPPPPRQPLSLIHI